MIREVKSIEERELIPTLVSEVEYSELRKERNLKEDLKVCILSNESTLNQDPNVKEEDVYTVDVITEEGISRVIKVPFQKGSIKIAGRNGVMIEELIEICIDRITKLNAKFPCTENEEAIGHLSKALETLDNRTRDRIARAVEGQHVK